MNNTTNYNLKKFVDSDNADLPSLCTNFDIIDDALTPTVDQTTAPTVIQKGKTGVVLGWLANRIKAIMGTANWWDAPPTNLTTVNTHISSTIIHAVASTSYLAFCGSVNNNELDAAFGKGNESVITNIGTQLAMYSWFMGRDKTAYPYTSLITKNTLLEIATDVTLCNSMVLDSVFLSLILSSSYATSMFFNNTRPLSDAVRDSIFFDSTLRNLVLSNYTARTILFGIDRPIVIYNQGDEKLTLTNGYVSSSGYGGTATKTNNKLRMTGASGGGMGQLSTTLKVSLPNFNKCKINMLENSGANNYYRLLNNANAVNFGSLNLGTGLKTFDVSFSTTDIMFECYYAGGVLAIDYIAFYCA